MSTDLSQGFGDAKSQISSIKTYIEVSKSAKKLKVLQVILNLKEFQMLRHN